MKTYKIDLIELAKEKCGANPEINVVAIRGLNWGSIGILSKSTDETYYWKDVSASYSSVAYINSETAWGCIAKALQQGNEILEFKNFQEFCQWYLKEFPIKSTT